MSCGEHIGRVHWCTLTYENIFVLISLLTNLGVLSDNQMAHLRTVEEVRGAFTSTSSMSHTRVLASPTSSATRTSRIDEGVVAVPYYSQLTDISSPTWQKIGCGIASLAMLIDYYTPGPVNVDTLLDEGISAGAYISNVGWSYAGLIGVSRAYGLTGASHDLGGTPVDTAFAQFTKALEKGPVMASVHYTFQPTNPIPHLVIVTGVKGDRLYYNDPALGNAGDSIPVSQFKNSWKKRYIEFWPVS